MRHNDMTNTDPGTGTATDGGRGGRLAGFAHPVVGYLLASLTVRYRRVRSGELDRGASAIEWVIIAAIVVGLVAGIGRIIMSALQGRASDVSDCIAGVQDTQNC
ncbi:Flp family type IVb pilin [Streptomyces alkaliphilus]|nr:hypothetical protein [Streptomyces alkaliphilus]